MLTNILLGLILGVVITSFVILNNKINRTEFNTKFIIDALKRIDKSTEATYLTVNNIQDRFNNKVLKNSERYNNIITLLKELSNATDTIYNRFNSTDNDIQNLIIGEHRLTRKEITKQAKISSKIKSKSKTNNNINKQ